MIKELNLQAPINRLGYGVVGTNICNSLSPHLKLNLFPIGKPQLAHDSYRQAVESALKNGENCSFECPTIKIYHQFALHERIGNGPYYGFPFFELDRFTPQELNSLKCPNRLIVASRWAKEILVDSGFIADIIDIVPCGVNTNIFYPKGGLGGSYIFFCCNKFEKRKCHDVIVSAFSKAFAKSDDVELHMCSHNPFLSEVQTASWLNLYRSSKLASKVKFFNPLETLDDVATFINNGDCGLYPSRAEAFNLPLLEAMACGKPVITTNYAAHTEYCNKDNAFLIEPDDTDPLEEAYDGKWFHGQGHWMAFDYEQEEQLIEHMRYCYKNRPENAAGMETAKQFSWANSAKKLLTLLGNQL